MKRLLGAIATLLLIPSFAFATPTSWDYAGGLLQPLNGQRSAEVRVPYITATSTASSTLPNLTATNFALTGKFFDGTGSQGTSGYLLQSTGSGVVFVATSSLGIQGGSSSLSDWTYTSNYYTPATSTAGIQINASSTIGAGTQHGGLTVSGGATTTLNAYFASNVGIGTTSPAYKLDVLSNTSNPAGRFTSSNDGGGTGLRIDTTDTNLGVITGEFDSAGNPFLVVDSGAGVSGYLQLEESGTQVMRIGQTFAGGQNISARSNLQIAIDSDNDGTGAFEIAKGSLNGRVGTDGTSLFRINNDDNVGIGTTSPGAKLGVAGNAYIGGNLTATGTLALPALTASRALFLDTNSIATTTGTVGNLESSVGAQNILLETEIDACSELAALLDGETGGCNGTSGPVFPDSPTFSGTSIFANYTATNGTTTNASSTSLFSTVASFLTSLIIPNGTNPTADDPGEIAHDTTDNQIILDDYVVGRSINRLFGFKLASTTLSFAAGATTTLPQERDGYTVTDIHCFVEGGTSKIVTLFGETITCTANGAEDDGSIASPTVAALATSTNVVASTTIGTVNYLNVSIFGNWTRK